MSTSAESTKANETPLSSDVIAYVRHNFGGRRGLIILAVIALGAGAFSNWGWLVAAGIAPLLLALAPCALMCAAGLCMSKMGGGSCSSDGKASATANSSEAADSELSQSMEPPVQQSLLAADRTGPAAPARLNGKAPERKTPKGTTKGQRQTKTRNAKPERRAHDD